MHAFDTPQPILAQIELVVGDLEVEAGERSDTTVEVRPTDATRAGDLAAAERTRVEYADGRLLVRAPRPRSFHPFRDSGSVHVRVALPAGSRVTAETTAAGGHQLSGRLGDCRLKTAVGGIRLERATELRAQTTAGDIDVAAASGDVVLRTGTGVVSVGALEGTTVITNSNGDTAVAEISGELTVKAANGHIAIDRADGTIAAKTANGSVRVGAARRGSVVAETALGAVEIGVVAGTAAWLDLHTHFGHVENELATTDGPPPDGERLEVRARSSMGDITVRRSHPAEVPA
ncbi:MAG: DUF4097 family beta strand repeat-containing protein [Solirubrobacteraceae bacterium]